jgi:cytochrome c oxidase accessory protein FixG
LIVAAVTGLMLFDFCYFREQLCIIACPYGRFQSVLLDQNSLIVSYDERRGEPRGKLTRAGKATTASKLDAAELTPSAAKALPVLGDCIDCRLCVTTCPTGIDIRRGLQMECINCTQCMDACDAVMRKSNRPTGLIRYSSQNRDRGERAGLLRARTMIYPLLLLGIATLFSVVLASQRSFHAVLLREPKLSKVVLPDGQVQNLLRLKLTNRIDALSRFQLTILEPAAGNLDVSEQPIEVGPGASNTFHFRVTCSADQFRNGRAPLRLVVANDRGESREMEFQLMGPYRSSATAPPQTISPSTKPEEAP